MMTPEGHPAVPERRAEGSGAQGAGGAATGLLGRLGPTRLHAQGAGRGWRAPADLLPKRGHRHSGSRRHGLRGVRGEPRAGFGGGRLASPGQRHPRGLPGVPAKPLALQLRGREAQRQDMYVCV